MSENENQPPAPSKQTSSVPLKKETVRVTLKAADAPPAATLPGGAPVVRPPTPTVAPTPTAAGGPPRPGPAPTIPLRPAGAPTAAARPGPAPTIPLRPAGAPTVPGAPGAPAPTAPGAGAPTAPARPGPAPTIPLRPAGSPTLPGAGATPAPGPTVALPKATVQLAPPTQPIGTTRPSFTSAATMQAEEESSTAGEGAVKALAVLSGIAAIALFAFQILTAKIWIDVDDNPIKGDWGQNLLPGVFGASESESTES